MPSRLNAGYPFEGGSIMCRNIMSKVRRTPANHRYPWLEKYFCRRIRGLRGGGEINYEVTAEIEGGRSDDRFRNINHLLSRFTPKKRTYITYDRSGLRKGNHTMATTLQYVHKIVTFNRLRETMLNIVRLRKASFIKGSGVGETSSYKIAPQRTFSSTH